MPNIPLPIQSYPDAAPDAINTRLVNCYAVPTPTGARAPFTVDGCAGLKGFSSIGFGPVRGNEVLLGDLYSTSGATVFKVTSDGSAVEWGTIPDGNLVRQDAGFNFIIALDDAGNAYLIDEDGVAQLTNLPFPAADVVFYDGFFVFIRKDTGEFYVSKLVADPGEKISFDVLNFQTAEMDSDIAVGLATTGTNLWVIGAKTVQVFANVSGFPFATVKGLFFNVGSNAINTIRNHNGVIYWLGNDNVFYKNGQRVSDLAVERSIVNSENIELSFSYAFKEFGNSFIALTISSTTWVFDLQTEFWHERATYERDTWQPITAIFHYGKQLMGDGLTNLIMELNDDVKDFIGTPNIALQRTPYVHADDEEFSIDFLDIFARTGVGTIETPDPKIMIRYSVDGGRVFSSEIVRSLGAKGNYRTPIRIIGMGRAKDLIIETSVSDPVEKQLISMFLGVSRGRRR